MERSLADLFRNKLVQSIIFRKKKKVWYEKIFDMKVYSDTFPFNIQKTIFLLN